MDITLVWTHPITQLDPNIIGKKPICCTSKQLNSLGPATWIIPWQILVDTDRSAVSEGWQGCQAERPVLSWPLPLLLQYPTNQESPLPADRVIYGRLMISCYFWDKGKIGHRKEGIISSLRLGGGMVIHSRRWNAVELTTPAIAQGHQYAAGYTWSSWSLGLNRHPEGHLVSSLSWGWSLPISMPAWVGKTSLKGDCIATLVSFSGWHNTIEQIWGGFLDSRSDNPWESAHHPLWELQRLMEAPVRGLGLWSMKWPCSHQVVPLAIPSGSEATSIFLTIPRLMRREGKSCPQPAHAHIWLFLPLYWRKS